MKNALTLAAIVAVFTVLTAGADEPKTVHWHFPGADGTPAPASVTDTSGELTMNRCLQGTAAGRVLTDQMSQSDDISGTHMGWVKDGASNILPASTGSVQMYQYELTNDVPKIRHAVYYSIDDSDMTKTLFPTNVSGDLLPFTVEITFKAAPHDADAFNSSAKNFSIFALTRRTRTSTGNTVFRINVISGGQIQLQCESQAGGNGNVCSQAVVNEADFRDGEWHHLALAYSLDETADPHQGTVRVYFDGVLKTDYVITKNSTIRSFKYTEIDDGVTVENAAYFSVGGTANSGVDLSVSDLRVTQAALGADELLRFGTAERLKERFSGTIARWTFDAPGQSGETVGSEYGAVTSVEGTGYYELAGGTTTGNRNWESDGEYPPLFTNEVPCAYVWDQAAGRIVNPENSTSVFFQHASEDGESVAQSPIGSTLYTARNTLKDIDLMPSNFTYECFVKADKFFNANVSGLFGLVSGPQGNLIMTRIDLVHGTEPRHQYYVTDVSENSTVIRPYKTYLKDAQWHHVAANYDVSSGTSAVVKLWVDYELVGTKETVGNVGSFRKNKIQVVFGAGCGVSAFSGMIDEPRISVGDIGPERFLRAFVPREDLTSVWLVPTNSVVSGDEWHSPGTSWLRGAWTNGAVSLSSDLPADNTVLRLGGKNVPLYGSVEFSGAGGITVPCAALTGTNVFTVEANFCGTGEVFAKNTFPGYDAWAVGADEDGFAYVELNGVRTTTAVQAGDGCWHHVALAIDRASAKTAVLYVDGEAAATLDASAMTVDAGDFVIGEGFEGSIVGVRFSAGVPPKKFFVARPPYGTVLTVR